MAEEKKNIRYVFSEPYTFVINRDKFRTAINLLRIEIVDFLKKNFTGMLISEACITATVQSTQETFKEHCV